MFERRLQKEEAKEAKSPGKNSTVAKSPSLTSIPAYQGVFSPPPESRSGRLSRQHSGRHSESGSAPNTPGRLSSRSPSRDPPGSAKDDGSDSPKTKKHGKTRTGTKKTRDDHSKEKDKDKEKDHRGKEQHSKGNKSSPRG